MKIRIILSNSGGELDRQVIEANENASTDLSDSIYDAIKAWPLAPGDTITIKEVGYAS
jgi:hypothetical protein